MDNSTCTWTSVSDSSFIDSDISLVDSDISTVAHPLGASFINSDAEYSLIDVDTTSDIEHGDLSVISISDIEDIEADVSDEGFTDLDQFSNVLAVPHIKRRLNLVPRHRRTLQEKAMSEVAIVSAITKSCPCPRECLDFINYQQAYRLRQIFWTKTRVEKSEWLISKLENSQKVAKWTYVFLDNGHGVCASAFQSVMNINKNSMTKHKQLVTKSSVSVSCRERQPGSRMAVCVDWLEQYASVYADRMPNSREIILPFKTQKRTVFQSYFREIRTPVKESTFYSIWKKHFPQLRIKKTNGFAQCRKCASLQNKLESTTCPVEKNEIRKERTLHNQRQMLERKYYYSKKAASKREPDQFLSLIIDGMDQSKTDLPHFTGRPSKAINPADLMGTHVTGVMSHGHDLFLTYVDVLEYPHDPNLTINVLIKALLHIASIQERLPPVLYLQADNCFRENKNKFVLAFLETLVRQRIFHEVHLSFLYTGHTHEDIDAGFSRISRQLNKNKAETLPDLLTLLPTVAKIESCLDVKSWLLPNLCTIKHISTPMHYKIGLLGKTVKVYYKGQQHTPWLLLNGRGTFLRNIPQGHPKILKPDFLKFSDKVPKLRKQIEVIKNSFSSESKLNWWINFLDKQNYVYRVSRNHAQWINLLPRQPVQRKPRRSINIMDEDLRKRLEKETAIPEVTCEKSRLKASRSAKRKQQKSHGAGKQRQPQSNDKDTQSKGNRQRKNQRILSASRLVLVPMDGELKKHIWLMIFIHLIGLCLSFIYYWICGLQNIVDLLLLLWSIWFSVIANHIGQQMAKVATSLYPVAAMCR